MATTIAISGKGGSGKTTLAAMLIRYLLDKSDRRAVLAVDADPNSCLALTLGIEPVGTISQIREQARAKSPSNVGTDRLRSFEYGIQQVITEAKGFDLLTMGRPEGPECYCAANNMLRTFLDKLSSQYEYVIIDNEAGMEHLSRRTTNNVDLLCIVAEPTSLSIVTVQRICELARELPISVKKIGVVWNNCKEGVTAPNVERLDISQLGSIPYDKEVFEASMQGKTVFDIDENNPVFLAVQKIFES